jgi:hypothetical protein
MTFSAIFTGTDGAARIIRIIAHTARRIPAAAQLSGPANAASREEPNDTASLAGGGGADRLQPAVELLPGDVGKHSSYLARWASTIRGVRGQATTVAGQESR